MFVITVLSCILLFARDDTIAPLVPLKKKENRVREERVRSEKASTQGWRVRENCVFVVKFLLLLLFARDDAIAPLVPLKKREKRVRVGGNQGREGCVDPGRGRV